MVRGFFPKPVGFSFSLAIEAKAFVLLKGLLEAAHLIIFSGGT